MNTMMNKLGNVNDKLDSKVIYGMSLASVAISTNPILKGVMSFADNKVNTKAPKVDKSGNVTFDGPSGTNAQSGVTKLLENGQFWVGVATGFAALILVGTGIWQAMKASKMKMEGNQQAYQMASNVMIGAFIGGAMMAAVSAFLSIGVSQGNDFFKSGN